MADLFDPDPEDGDFVRGLVAAFVITATMVAVAFAVFYLTT